MNLNNLDNKVLTLIKTLELKSHKNNLNKFICNKIYDYLFSMF